MPDSPQGPYAIEWPRELLEDAYEIECKGYLVGVRVRLPMHAFDLSFIDEVRLMQDVRSELEQTGYAQVKRVFVVPSVTKEVMSNVIRQLLETETLE